MNGELRLHEPDGVEIARIADRALATLHERMVSVGTAELSDAIDSACDAWTGSRTYSLAFARKRVGFGYARRRVIVLGRRWLGETLA